MASSPITSCQIDGETVETVSDFILGGSKITVDGDCSHESKRRLFLGRKVMTNLDNIFKSRDITLPTKFCLVKAMVFPVVIYGCDSWTVKKAEHWRIDVFELWCWRKLLRVPWTAGRFNQSILKEISPGVIGRTDVEAETLILWPPDVKSWVTGKDPDAGKDWGQEEKGTTEDEMVGWHNWLNGHGLSKLWEIGKNREARCAAVHGVAKSWTWLGDWKTTAYHFVSHWILSELRHQDLCFIQYWDQVSDLSWRTIYSKSQSRLHNFTGLCIVTLPI